MEIYPVGDHALTISLGDTSNIALSRRLYALQQEIMGFPGVINALAGYTTLVVEWDPLTGNPEHIQQKILQWDGRVDALLAPARHWKIPVYYGGADGPDLEFVAQYHGISGDQVVALHSFRPYPIYCLGFALGFPYLGDLPCALHTPRRSTPRTRVPGGSVAIGGTQTGFYPVETPGGWHIIGRTPVSFVHLDKHPPVAYKPGDTMEFVPIPQSATPRGGTSNWQQ